MKRREIIDQAKNAVLGSGPYACLYDPDNQISHYDLSTEDYQALLAEIQHQARRVFNFLGFDPE